MTRSPITGLIMAAGKGTRMKSDLPKCLHPVCELPMAEHLIRALKGAGVEVPGLIVGHGGEALLAAIQSDVQEIWQKRQLGTGHAILQAEPVFRNFNGPILIVPGDSPLITSKSLLTLSETLTSNSAAAVIASVKVKDPTGYGRIVRDTQGNFKQIVEEKDAEDKIRKIDEVNVSVYCFDSKLLFQMLPKVRNNNAQGEYYLTDVLSILLESGAKVLVEEFEDEEEFQGVNNRWQLASAETSMRLRILKKHALNGVTIINPHNTFIGPDVEIEPDSIVETGSIIKKRSKVATGSIIGPYSLLSDSTIAPNCKILMSNLTRCEIGENSTVGPYANVRPHTRVGENCKIGNFVEVKNTTLHDRVSASHLTYLGDAEIGSGTNIGAGTIICNYDGFEKHRTEIGENVFIGSNSTIVAPRVLESDSMVAAGSVVTSDVPAGAAAFGRTRTEIKQQWAIQWRQQMKKRIEAQRTSTHPVLKGETKPYQA